MFYVLLQKDQLSKTIIARDIKTRYVPGNDGLGKLVLLNVREEGAFSSHRRRLLPAVVHSFSFTPSAGTLSPRYSTFFSCNKEDSIEL